MNSIIMGAAAWYWHMEDVAAEGAGRVAHLLVGGVVAVAHVEARHVHALVRQLKQLLAVPGSRPDGAHQLGLPEAGGSCALLDIVPAGEGRGR